MAKRKEIDLSKNPEKGSNVADDPLTKFLARHITALKVVSFFVTIIIIAIVFWLIGQVNQSSHVPV